MSFRALIVVSTGVAVFAGCAEQPMKVQPAVVDFRISDEHRAALADDVRKILEMLEEGRLTGADASRFQSTLDQATDIKKGKKTARYLFAADGHQVNLKGIQSCTSSSRVSLIASSNVE